MDLSPMNMSAQGAGDGREDGTRSHQDNNSPTQRGGERSSLHVHVKILCSALGCWVGINLCFNLDLQLIEVTQNSGIYS